MSQPQTITLHPLKSNLYPLEWQEIYLSQKGYLKAYQAEGVIPPYYMTKQT